MALKKRKMAEMFEKFDQKLASISGAMPPPEFAAQGELRRFVDGYPPIP